MTRRITLACLAALAMTVPSRAQETAIVSLLAPLTVTTEYDHSVPLAGRTYSWGQEKLVVPQYTGVVHTAIDANLQKRGWHLVPSGGSVTIFALGDVRGQDQLEDFYKGNGGWGQPWSAQGWGAGWKPQYGEATFNALNVPENNLVVDMFDSGNHRLLFRGVLEDDLSGTEKKTTKLLNKNFKRMFKKFPPKS